MKLTLFIVIVIGCMQVNASGYAQKITLSVKNTPLERVFQEVKKQSGYLFWYENSLLNNTKKVDLDLKNVSLKYALDECFKDQPLSYQIVGNTIVIKNREITVNRNLEREIRGVVSDSVGPIPGVSVKLKDKSTVGTSTDNYGRFSLKIPDDNAILVFSMVGYDKQEVPVKSLSVLNVRLVPTKNTLEDVVVVAFGTQKKTDMVGSVTSIKPADLKVPSSNLTTALAGRAAGVIAYQRSGEPGEDNADFFIRGVTSFGTGKVNPLILIDGVELGVTELARLRPDDIESFSIMKDATSTALYGARGANGVIYVTTKQGKEGVARISFRAEGSMSQATSKVEFADPVTFMKLYNEAQYARHPFENPFYTQEKIDGTAEGISPIIYPAVDWQKMLFKDRAFNQRYNLNVSGGGKVARYYVAGSLAQDNGVIKMDKINNFNNGIDLKSYTLRANVNIDLSNTTELIVRLNGNFDDYTGPIDGGGELFNKVIRSNPVNFLPYYPAQGKHSSVQHIMFGGDSKKGFLNPYADMVKGYKDYNRSLMLAQLELKQNLSFLTEGLTFRTMMNTNRISRYDIARSYNPFFYEIRDYDKRTLDYNVEMFNEDTGREFLDFTLLDDLRQQSTVFYMESAINYNRTFSNKHSLSGLLVYIMRSGTNARAGNLQLSLPSRNLGLSGRTTYGYDNRYFAEFNFGYNGSERFHESKRFGFFPSAGLAWTISNEKFWQPFKDKVNNFRLRATYGLVGNDAIGLDSDRFFYLSNVDMTNSYRGFTFGREGSSFKNGINVDRYSNPDITWETAYKTNLALELGLFNKVNIQADFFSEKRRNILMKRASIPSTMGLTADLSANVGEANAKGMDISIDYSHNFKNGMWLQSRGNFTYATNKRTVFEEPIYQKEWWKSMVGYPINQQWGYIAERLFVDDNEVNNSPAQNFGSPNVAGDIKYKDVNNDGQITELDMVPIGLPTVPEIVYGVGFSLGFKNFDISTFFQGSAISSFWIDPTRVEPFSGGKQIMKAFADNHFSPEQPNSYALWPRLSTETHSNNLKPSTWWINNGSFLRLKQAEIGYSIPAKTAQRLKMQNMRFYVSGTNLLLLSHFKLWDIEMGGNGLGYPLQKVFNLGLNVTF
ncbi:MAG: TonB-dependent receptor [Pedobacter sp.]|uniref:TonB-dependent receptor n=1 Tax=Pedobacter sp. TaxID=1411316 RepID=UPI0035616257